MMRLMRTTLTLDDDLAMALRERARERGVPFKRVVNEAIREGLAQGPRRGRRYRVPKLVLRARPGVELEKALALADRFEDTEIARKLTLGR